METPFSGVRYGLQAGNGKLSACGTVMARWFPAFPIPGILKLNSISRLMKLDS